MAEVKIRYFYVALLWLFGVAFPQDCPIWGDSAGALKYLQENRTNSTMLDAVCVNTAFATLSHDKSSAEALVGLLDFERSRERDDFKTRGGKYPAVGALMTIGKSAVPYLIKALKESDSELVRTNAGDALGAMYRPCVRGLMATLEVEATKSGISSEQQARLRNAKEQIGNFYPPCKSESST